MNAEGERSGGLGVGALVEGGTGGLKRICIQVWHRLFGQIARGYRACGVLAFPLINKVLAQLR